MRPIKKHCIFDLDGTLFDSMENWPRAMIQVMDEAGLKYPDDVVNIITPLGYKGCAEYFISLGHPEKDPDVIVEQIYDYLTEDYTYKIDIKPYVKVMLESLCADGIKVYALTASPHRMVDPCLKRNGIYHLFEAVWSTDDFGRIKSDPKIYEETLQKIGIKADEVEFYDDNEIALRTAKSIGIRVIGVYDPLTEKYRNSIESFADGYVECFSEMIK